MGKWNDYLILLQKKGIDWTDPKLLMCQFSITKKAAQQIIDRRLSDIDDAVENELTKREWESVSND